MTRRAYFILCFLLPACLVIFARPGIAAELTGHQQEQILDEAQAAYEQGVAILRTEPLRARDLFLSAADRFQLLINQGIANGGLMYNLANAQLQAGRLGLAILNYRRAEKLLPGDARLLSNLKYARSLRRNQFAANGRQALLDVLLNWHRRTSLLLRSRFFAIFNGVFWMILLGWLIRKTGPWRYASITCAILWGVLGISVGSDLLNSSGNIEGVMIADDVMVRKGNGEGFEPQFEEPLHQGVEFELIETRADWIHIRLPNSATGWIRMDQAGMIDSPRNTTALSGDPIPRS